MPALRQILATGVPSAPCLMMNALCASENFNAFMLCRSAPSRDIVAENSIFKRFGLRGTDQLLASRLGH